MCVSTSQLKIFCKADYLMGNVDHIIVCVASLRRLYCRVRDLSVMYSYGCVGHSTSTSPPHHHVW